MKRVFYSALVLKCTEMCKHLFRVQLLQNPPLCISTVKSGSQQNEIRFLNLSVLDPDVPYKLCLAGDSEPTRNDKGTYSKPTYCLLFCLEIFCSNRNDSTLIKVISFFSSLYNFEYFIIFTVIFRLFALSSLITVPLTSACSTCQREKV